MRVELKFASGENARCRVYTDSGVLIFDGVETAATVAVKAEAKYVTNIINAEPRRPYIHDLDGVSRIYRPDGSWMCPVHNVGDCGMAGYDE